MKNKIVITVLVCFFMFKAFGQFPQAFNYQTIARDNNGNLLQNQSLSFRISIVYGSNNGSIVYSELQNVTTNQFGLANFAIGKGAAILGKFSDIDWSLGNYYIKNEIANDTGGYQEIGISSLLSVPYALYALQSGIPGFTGITGTQRTKGSILKNNIDSTGTTGVTGATGIQGVTGPTGATGTNGTNGNTGSTGIGYNGLTSNTSITISTGIKTFTTNLSQSQTAFIVGNRVRIINNSIPYFMEGMVATFNTNTMIVNVDYTVGSGTFASWNITITGAVGAAGIAGGIGIQGIQGITGSTGGTGFQGIQGINGITGLTGNTGLQGVQGVTGTTGRYWCTGHSGYIRYDRYSRY